MKKVDVSLRYINFFVINEIYHKVFVYDKL